MSKFRIVICLLINMLIINGCTTFLIDRAGAGGYAQDARRTGAMTSDVNITANVKATLIRDNQIDAFNIRVNTYRGVVTLYGQAKSSAQITRSISLARTINGVKKVISKLIVIK